MRRITLVEALNEALHEEMDRGALQLLVGEDVSFGGGLFGATAGLAERFGTERVLDMPISEAGFTGFALGSAMVGTPALVEVQLLPFIALAMDQICNRAAKLRYMTGGQVGVPLVIRSPAASRIGLAAQHSDSVEGWFMQVAGLKVVTPATPADAKGLLKAAIRDPDPVVFIEHRALYSLRGEVSEDPEELIPLGRARVAREGRDITLIAHSIGLRTAETAAAQLAKRGIEAEVIDLRTVKPLDVETLARSVAKTERAIVVSDGAAHGGVAGEVVASLIESPAFDHLDAPIRRVTPLDVPVPYAAELERVVMPRPDTVVGVAEELVGR
jgi:pyruvate/2-oxoglutarate/acetoin dehydrogenase E1 component